MRPLRLWPTVRALAGSSHPGPTLVVTALALALGLSVGLEPWRLVLLTLGVLSGQFSVGISNDAIDAPRDRAVGRRDKPVARGDVSERAAWVAAFVALTLGLALVAPLGWRLVAAHAFALGCAWSYNAGLKSSGVSIVPFIASFGIFPSFAPLSLPAPSFAPGWAWIAGGALGAAVHLTNVLPDLDDDARTGVRGLPHRLGPRISAVIAALAVIGGAVAVLLGPVVTNRVPSGAGSGSAGVTAVSWVFFAGVVLTGVATLVLAAMRPPTRTVFRLVMLAALLLAVQLVVSGQSLAA